MNTDRIADGAETMADVLDGLNDAGLKTGKTSIFTRLFAAIIRRFGGRNRG